MHDNTKTNKKLRCIYSLSRTNWFSLPHGLWEKGKERKSACVCIWAKVNWSFPNIMCIFCFYIYSLWSCKVNTTLKYNINFECAKWNIFEMIIHACHILLRKYCFLNNRRCRHPRLCVCWCFVFPFRRCHQIVRLCVRTDGLSRRFGGGFFFVLP